MPDPPGQADVRWFRLGASGACSFKLKKAASCQWIVPRFLSPEAALERGDAICDLARDRDAPQH
jgi:hypothetical protein